MNEIWIKIFPNDTLFFRSGRPFTMGSETWSDVIFPPYPSTIYGALRTFLLFHRGGNLKNFDYEDIGTPIKKGKLQLFGPILCEKKNTLFFPVPLDLVVKKGADNESLILSKIEKPDIFFSDCELENILFYKKEGQVDNVDGFLDDITLSDYLLCKEEGQKFRYVKRKVFYTYETKIGIARERTTLTSKEGYLYRIPMIRLTDGIGILVKVSGVDKDMPQEGILQLGGEGKTAYYKKLDQNPLDELEKIQLNFDNGRIFKIYLATPAIFKKGWIPEWIDENTMSGTYKNQVKLKLISCVIGKYVRVGGWDMAKNKPKPMYKAVPAGSVYYFKVLDESPPEKIKELFHLKNISEINPEEGFGLTLIGGA